MGKVVHLPVSTFRQTHASSAGSFAGLAEKISKLEAAVTIIGDCIKTCEQFLRAIKDPVARAAFEREARHLHDQLLLASIELVRLNLAFLNAEKYGLTPDACAATR